MKRNKMIAIESKWLLEKAISYLCFFLIIAFNFSCKKTNEILIIFKENEVIKNVEMTKHRFSLKELERGISVSLRLINETGHKIEVYNEIEDQKAFGLGVQLTVQSKNFSDLAFHSITFFNQSESTNYGSKGTKFVQIVKSDFNLKIESQQLKNYIIEPNKELQLTQTMHELYLPKYTKWVRNPSKSIESFYDFDHSYYIQINPHLIFSYRILNEHKNLEFFINSDCFGVIFAGPVDFTPK